MKIRTDFVTNSSSSSYLVTLKIDTKDRYSIKYQGYIYEPDGGYLGADDCDPKDIACAESMEELFSMINGFGNLCAYEVSVTEENGGVVYKLDDPEHFIFEEDMAQEEVNEKFYGGYIDALKEHIKSPDDITTVAVECDSEEAEEGTRVYEKHEYDKASNHCNDEYKATESGEDVTDQMLNDYYTIDMGDDVIEFQLIKAMKR